MLKSPNIRIVNKERGLTLIEALVAITVLTIGVLGPLTMAARGIGDGLFARNQLAANYLAQEALELMINRNYYLNRVASVSPLPAGQTIYTADPDIVSCVNYTAAGHYCSLAAESAGVAPAANCANTTDADCQLLFDAGTGGSYLYKIAANRTGDKPIGPAFYRLVQLAHPVDESTGLADERRLKVTVTVQWKNKTVDKELKMVEILFDESAV